MDSGKVLILPILKAKDRDSDVNFTQLDLFNSEGHSFPKVAVVEPSDYYEEEFLSAIQRNNISLIIDMRERPIFERPNYSHKRITSYFFHREIRYIDIVHLVHSENADLEGIKQKLGYQIRSLSAGSDFFGLCLIDENARASGVVSEFRAQLRRQTSSVVEVHPRAIGL